MKLLFMHPNMPGQYKHLCRIFAADPKNQVVFCTKAKHVEVPGVHRMTYEMPRDASPHTHRYLINAERAVLQGQEVWRMCKQLKEQEGFVPDVICAHPGWGDTLYVKDIFPNSPLLSFFEFYYQSHGADVNFDPADPVFMDDDARVRTKNITNLMSLEASDWGVTPTWWQHSVHPPVFQPRISVLHDGIDTEFCKPNPKATLQVKPGVQFKPGDEVVTYIARNFEPYRGFPTFMKAAEIILRERPNCHIIAVGADEVSYGRPAPKGETYRGMLAKEVNLPSDRMHWVGTLAYHELIHTFQISACHIYLTFPFVLSWSMLESMATGCALVGSKTPPVEEVITHGVNGRLADFFSAEDVAKQVIATLEDKTKNAEMRAAARQTVLDRYALQKVLPLHEQLVRDVAAKQFPPPVNEKILELYQPRPSWGALPQVKERRHA